MTRMRFRSNPLAKREKETLTTPTSHKMGKMMVEIVTWNPILFMYLKAKVISFEYFMLFDIIERL